VAKTIVKGGLLAHLVNVLDDVADLARRRIRRGSALRRWLGRLRAPLRLRDPRSEISRFLLAFAEARPDAFFIQIGSNDGEQQDPLEPVIARYPWRGILIEPVPYVFERLQQNRGGDPRLALENVAIAEADGSRPFYYLAKAEDRTGLPRWYDALGSFRRDVLLTHVSRIADIETRIQEMRVPCLSFESLCRKHGVTRVDVLHMDVEGYDWQLLQSIDLARWRPALLVFEHHHLEPAAYAACRAHLEQLGYSLMPERLDTLAVRRVGLSRRLAARFDRAAERCYLAALHQPGGPAPPDADRDLRDDNLELQDLRRRYASATPTLELSRRWSPASAARHARLRNFRGESLYLWHYRESEAVTRRKYEAYLRHLMARDTAGLLRRLSEDGAFGCWTFSFPGLPTVSRDLLDSINELLFLDRHLGVLSRRGLRVLDIGAGYGRLAHRLAAAAPGLADYCCVDAVPESTFLSRYYLEYRKCAPPARVVPLDRVRSDLAPGSFDLAVNIHSFSECTHQAIAGWVGELQRLRVPHLLIVPNDGAQLLSSEPDGARRAFGSLLAASGYRLAHSEPALGDPAVRELTGIHDEFLLFRLEPARG